jgi:3-dehydroquinate synthase
MNGTSTKIAVNRDGAYCYSIWLEPDFENIREALESLQTKEKKLCIVTDDAVAPLYAEKLIQVLKPCCKKISLFVFKAGECNKTLDTVRALYEHLILEKFDRKDMLVALGGGVVGDLTGFAAATYLRGIDFIQVPTTLLSQVDSSIGGKTGVDFDAYKNMVGAFHMPKLVYMNLETLKTLPKRQFSAGMAEIIKHGLIQDEEYFWWLTENAENIMDGQYEVLRTMISASCQIKRHVVEVDPTEKGIRAWLNFGHTAGHAVEKLMDFQLYHGECVAIGCVAAAWLSWKRGFLTKADYDKIREAFVQFELPVQVVGVKPEDVLKTTKLDKKMEGGRIKFVLLKQIGEAFVTKDVEDEELLQAIQQISKETKHE